MDGDRKMLTQIIDWMDDHPEEVEHRRLPEGPMRDMFRCDKLSKKQAAWVRSVHSRIFDEPDYLNLFSSGKVRRGAPVETPEVLRHLPLKPPGGRP